jgi:hypothetical protein
METPMATTIRVRIYARGEVSFVKSLFLLSWFAKLFFFLRITQYIGDTHDARTLIPVNRRTQTLSLGASSKTVPANPQD